MFLRFDSETKHNVALVFSNGYLRKIRPSGRAFSFCMLNIIKDLWSTEECMVGQPQINAA